MKKVIPFVRILTTLMVVFFLLLTSIRLLLSPFFLNIEYKMPAFPEDQYGFSMEERLKWARISLSYLLNNEGIEYLENQELSPGQPLYNERELQHMLDVKNLVNKAMISWYIFMALLILFGLFANKYEFSADFWDAFSKGGIATVVLIVVILFGVLVSFDALFTGFHRIFFEGDTWLFRFSDTLIRLFPIRFWQDLFMMMGALSALGGIIVYSIGRLMGKKSHQRNIEPV